MSDLPDIVYVVKPGDANEELRYSLRSVANLPHRHVVIAGSTPSWCRGVMSIDVPAAATKWLSSTKNLGAACSDPRVAGEIVYMNDDMFVMHPVDRMPVYHRGTIDDVIRDHHAHVMQGTPIDTRYLNGMERTARMLQRMGVDRKSMLSYELHVPLPVVKHEMARTIEFCRQLSVAHKRSMYGNLAQIGGVHIGDVKVSKRFPDWDPTWTFISTDDESFTTAVGSFIRDTFTEPGPYEVRP